MKPQVKRLKEKCYKVANVSALRKAKRTVEVVDGVYMPSVGNRVAYSVSIGRTAGRNVCKISFTTLEELRELEKRDPCYGCTHGDGGYNCKHCEYGDDGDYSIWDVYRPSELL